MEVAHADISVTNNTGTDARFTVTATSLPSRLLIADNTWATLSVDNTDTATDLEILRNRLSSFISVRDRVLNPFSTPSAQTRARIEDNHADADLQVTTAASQVLIQRNTATGLLFNGGVAVDYARLFGVRDNRLNDGILRLNLGGTGSQCLAVTGNQGDGLVLNGESELVVEGLSMLNTLNQFNLITLGNTFVEAAVDSCGIPH